MEDTFKCIDKSCEAKADYGCKLCMGCKSDVYDLPGGKFGNLRFCCRRACDGSTHGSNCEHEYRQYLQRKEAMDKLLGRTSLKQDMVNNPEHYTAHPSGVECITVTEHMGFSLGNVIKYVWRADLKGGVEDLKKARWYIDREIKRRETKVEGKAAVPQS